MRSVFPRHYRFLPKIRNLASENRFLPIYRAIAVWPFPDAKKDSLNRHRSAAIILKILLTNPASDNAHRNHPQPRPIPTNRSSRARPNPENPHPENPAHKSCFRQRQQKQPSPKLGPRLQARWAGPSGLPSTTIAFRLLLLRGSGGASGLTPTRARRLSACPAPRGNCGNGPRNFRCRPRG